MGKLASFVIGLFPSIQQELIDAKVTQALNREYHDQILRLRSEVARLREDYPTGIVEPKGPTWGWDQLSYTNKPISIDASSTSDAWTDEPLRKSKRQQCKDLEDMYRTQIEAEKAVDPEEVARDRETFYGQ